MKIKSCIYVLSAVLLCTGANAAYDLESFQQEVKTGIDMVVAPTIAEIQPENAIGELGQKIYETPTQAKNPNHNIYIPSSMYVRMGAGLTIPFATDRADFFDATRAVDNGYAAQIGLGWNLSSYVRTEIDFQHTEMSFKDTEQHAQYDTIGGMLYFDFARRYILSGDITHRRTFVPFMGLGASIGTYQFQGTSGSDGMIIAAPRATLGFNIMLNDLIGVDIAYQYQMMIGNGFGWGGHNGGVNNISNIMATIRANF